METFEGLNSSLTQSAGTYVLQIRKYENTSETHVAKKVLFKNRPWFV